MESRNSPKPVKVEQGLVQETSDDGLRVQPGPEAFQFGWFQGIWKVIQREDAFFARLIGHCLKLE